MYVTEDIIPPTLPLILFPKTNTRGKADHKIIIMKRRDAKRIFSNPKESQFANKSAIPGLAESGIKFVFPFIKLRELDRCVKKSILGNNGKKGKA